MVKSAALDAMNDKDQSTVTRLWDIFRGIDEQSRCDVHEYPTWFRLLWKIGSIKHRTLAQLRELSPQITDVEIDFVEKRLLMHFTRHGVPVPKAHKESKKRKRAETYELETTATLLDKDRGVLKALFAMVRSAMRCRPMYTIDAKDKSYIMSFRIREKINTRDYEKIWKRYHTHLASMTFNVEKGTLVLVINKTS